MKRYLCVVATLLMIPAAVAAADLSATLTGAGGDQGFAVLVTGSNSIDYTVVTNGIGTPTRAYIAQGNGAFVELNAAFANGSATGTVSTSAANISALNANPGNYTVRVEGPGGNLQGTLAGTGSGGPGPDPEPGECPSGYFTDPGYPDFCFRVGITAAGGAAVPTRRESGCIDETVCVSGAIPGRSELFIRIIGPRPNGFLWPTLVRFTPSEVRVDILQRSSGTTKSYTLPAVPSDSDELSGLQDREGFLPEGSGGS